MKEQGIMINGNAGACYGCDMLTEFGYEMGWCKKDGQSVRKINYCETGKLLFMPKQGQDIPKMLNIIEQTWRHEEKK